MTSSFWVAALIRRCQLAGAAAFVVRRGAEDAGAIFVTVDFLDGRVDLYGPAPQAMFDTDRPSDRRFERRVSADGAEIDRLLAREREFDPDIWVIAVEDRAGRSFIEPPPDEAIPD